MVDFTHLILTRFSVRAHRDGPPAPRAWLEYRLRLFEAYCLPSLAHQSCPRFSWLVFCDETTEPWCVEHLRSLAASAPQLTVALTSPDRSDLGPVASRAREEDRVLVTTRVDSDDASSIDFVERVQAYVPAFLASDHPAAMLNFSRGFKLDEPKGAVHDVWHPHSPHLTLYERLDVGRPAVTVQSGNHGFMQDCYPLQVDAGEPAWLQVVHGGNVINHVHPTDHEVAWAALEERFVLAAADCGEPVAAPQPDAAEARAAFRQALEETLS